MLVVLARHHHGGGSPPSEAFGFREDLLTRDYIRYAEDALVDAGVRVVVVSGVPYSTGKGVANTMDADVFVACHVNSGKYKTGCVFCPASSPEDHELASLVCTALGDSCPELERTRVWECKPGAWTDDALGTINRVVPPAICYEPFFINAVEHAALRHDEGLRRVGEALARGILEYLGA